MSEWLEPVIDRTQEDVNQVLNGINNDKGAFLSSVANRIEGNTEYICDLLNSNGYYVSVETKRWNREDIPNINEINRMKNNLEKLKQSFYIYNTTPSTDNSKISLNFRDINNMEKILFDIDEIIQKLYKSYKYSDTFYSGQEYTIFNTI